MVLIEVYWFTQLVESVYKGGMVMLFNVFHFQMITKGRTTIWFPQTNEKTLKMLQERATIRMEVKLEL